MNLSLKINDIRLKISALLQLVDASYVLPILEDFLIEIKYGVLTFTATDLETVASFSLPTESKKNESICVHAKQFSHFISNALTDEIQINVEKSMMTLTSGDFSAKIKCDNPLDFPKVPVYEAEKSIELKYDQLATKIKTALLFVSKDDLRPAMTGIYFQYKNEGINIAATDANCLYFDEVIKTSVDIPNFIMPAKPARFFLNFFKGKDVRVSCNEVHIQFSSDGLNLKTRTIDARYPAYENVIPVYDLSFYLKRKQVIAMLKLAAPFVNKSTNQVPFLTTQEKIKVTGGDTDFDLSFQYSIPVYNASMPFSEFEFAFNLAFFRKIVDVSKDENIKITHSTSSTKAIIIDDKFILMPLMLNN